MKLAYYVTDSMKARVQRQLAANGELNKRTWGEVAAQIIAADLAEETDEEAIGLVNWVKSFTKWPDMPTVDQLILEYETIGLDLTDIFDEADIAGKYELHPFMTNLIKKSLVDKVAEFGGAIRDLSENNQDERYEKAKHLVDSIYTLVKKRDMANGQNQEQWSYEVFASILIPYGWITDELELTHRYHETANDFADYVEGRTSYRPVRIALSDVEL